MVNTFTSHQIIRYVYQDCDPTEKMILEECIELDQEAREELKLLRLAKRELPDVVFSAHPQTLLNILAHSCKP